MRSKKAILQDNAICRFKIQIGLGTKTISLKIQLNLGWRGRISLLPAGCSRIQTQCKASARRMIKASLAHTALSKMKVINYWIISSQVSQEKQFVSKWPSLEICLLAASTKGYSIPIGLIRVRDVVPRATLPQEPHSGASKSKAPGPASGELYQGDIGNAVSLEMHGKNPKNHHYRKSWENTPNLHTYRSILPT